MICALLLLPAAGIPASAQEPDSTAIYLAEAQRLQQELGQIQRQALSQDTSLVTMQAEIRQLIWNEMVKADSSVAFSQRRLNDLAAEYQTAQQDQDFQRVVRLTAEAETLQEHISSVESLVLAREDILARSEAFRDSMITSMERVSPRTRSILARLEELNALLVPPPSLPPPPSPMH